MRTTERDQLFCRIAVRDNFADNDVFAGRFRDRLSTSCTAAVAEFALSVSDRWRPWTDEPPDDDRPLFFVRLRSLDRAGQGAHRHSHRRDGDVVPIENDGDKMEGAD
jgi:hypothetical protein